MPTYYKPKEQFDILTNQEVHPYITHARPDHAPLIALAYLTGARISELLTLTPKNFIHDKENQTLKIRIPTHKLKNKKPLRELQYNTQTDPYIKNTILPHLKQYKNINAKLFPLTKRRYQQLLKKLNETIHPHNKNNWITYHYFRHSAITYIARELDATIAEIKSYTGHRGTAYEEYIITKAPKRFKGKYSR